MSFVHPKNEFALQVTPEQWQNLRTLGEYLLKLEENPIPVKFNMAHYCSSQTRLDYRWHNPQNYTCGTVACAVGHGPHAGIAVIESDMVWNQYIRRVFGFTTSDTEHNEFSWCFSGAWVGIDNTAKGAGKRILWLLEHGLPEDASQQMRGESPLCYL